MTPNTPSPTRLILFQRLKPTTTSNDDEPTKAGQSGAQVDSSESLPLGNKIGRDNGDYKGRDKQLSLNQFEDDEDLYKSEAVRSGFINGHHQQLTNEDDEEQKQQQHWRSLDELDNQHQLINSDLSATPNDGRSMDELDLDSNNELSFTRDAPNNQRSNLAFDSKRESFAHDNNDDRQGASNNYLGVPLDSTRVRLSNLVHKIVPELSCYTGNGEHYQGILSTSSDRRHCLNWLQVGRSLKSDSRALKYWMGKNNHDHCRNPTGDPQGPWCFVLYNHELDEADDIPPILIRGPDYLTSNSSTSSQSIIARYVKHQCSVPACSDYLWLYIVAPPLGVLVILSCLIATLIRSFKRFRYTSLHLRARVGNLSRINKILGSRSRFSSQKFGKAKSKSCSKCIDEDVFEIVDDLDWSDGQTQSFSPKSNESLKLDSSFSSSTSADVEPRSGAYRVTSQILNDKSLDTPPDLLGVGRSLTQVGPTFATLRCHIRGQGAAKSQRSATANRLCESSTIKRLADLMTLNPEPSPSPYPANCHKSISLISSTSRAASSLGSNSTNDNKTTRSKEESEQGLCGDDMPRLDSSSVTIAVNQQLIYEGKYSQVQLAYIQKAHPTSPGEKDASLGYIGTQVAVLSLKQNASIDSAIFEPAKLRLRNLNHLNILKLIGITQLLDEATLDKLSYSLVFDLAQLVDLTEWLRQQNRDSLISSEPGSDLGTKGNLSCLAKQIALAIDYLHDRGVIYKDLACRNCFLDPTKMLVKLASFNIELLLDSSDSKTQNLNSMIRPKYLLDYYMIDSRPSEGQLLPLSWIPLESILFNKFNVQTDVWSFGCLLYELFSLGEIAYFGYSSKQIIDAVRSNLMPPQPLLCPNGIYKTMCKCLSDIPTNRPNVKQIYEELNLYSGQCSSFLDHHLCSLAMSLHDSKPQGNCLPENPRTDNQSVLSVSNRNKITKTKSYANIKKFHSNSAQSQEIDYQNLAAAHEGTPRARQEGMKMHQSKSINLEGNRLASFGRQGSNLRIENEHYDEPVVG